MHGASSSFSSSFCHTICVTGGVCCLCYCLQFTSSSLAASWSSAAWCLTYWEFIRRHQYELLLPGWFWIRQRWMAIVALYKNRSFLLPVLRTCVSDPVAENWLYYAQQFLRQRDNLTTQSILVPQACIAWLNTVYCAGNSVRTKVLSPKSFSKWTGATLPRLKRDLQTGIKDE